MFKLFIKGIGTRKKSDNLDEVERLMFHLGIKSFYDEAFKKRANRMFKYIDDLHEMQENWKKMDIKEGIGDDLAIDYTNYNIFHSLLMVKI